MNWQEHITADPAVLVGKPVIKGTRLAVEFILELIAEGWSETDSQLSRAHAREDPRMRGLRQGSFER